MDDAYREAEFVTPDAAATAPEQAQVDAEREERADTEAFNRLRLVPEPSAETELATEPEVAEPVLEPEAEIQDSPLSDLMEQDTNDPFQRYGFDFTRASEIAAGASLSVPEHRVDEFIAAFEKSELEGEDGFRQFCSAVKEAEVLVEEKRAERARIDALEERLRERETQGPGSPLAQEVADIKRMLSAQHEEKQQQEYVQVEAQRVAQSHGAALAQLARLALARGIEPPSREDVDRFYAMTGAERLEPNYAARLAWTELVGPELFGPKQGPQLPYSRNNPAGFVTRRGEIRSAPIVPGSPARSDRSLQDLLQGESDEMDDNQQGGF